MTGAQPIARVRTFHPRRGRLSTSSRDAIDRLWQRYGLTVATTAQPPLDPAAVFGRTAPLVLEIGSGMGESTAAMAAADPGRDHLAVEVHTPGIGNLLRLIEHAGLANVRVADGDALDLLRHQIPPDSVDAIHIFFPDPWPKARHHKRRLVQPAHLPLLVSRLRPGGTLWMATDWPGYAHDALAALAAHSDLVNTHDGFAPRPDARALTKFEQRASVAGRDVFDLVFRRGTAPRGYPTAQ